jgi:hypothetical protein
MLAAETRTRCLPRTREFAGPPLSGYLKVDAEFADAPPPGGDALPGEGEFFGDVQHWVADEPEADSVGAARK